MAQNSLLNPLESVVFYATYEKAVEVQCDKNSIRPVSQC